MNVLMNGYAFQQLAHPLQFPFLLADRQAEKLQANDRSKLTRLSLQGGYKCLP
jgi:hypothetical protein